MACSGRPRRRRASCLLPSGARAEEGKNRLHLDLAVARDVPPEEYHRRIDDEADRLRQAGATKLRAVEKHGEYWVTMLDPEGNEFDLM